MPINFEGNIFYSVRELSHLLAAPHLSRNLAVTEDNVTTFILEKDFNKKQMDGTWYLQRESLGDFFAQFSSLLGVSPQYYEIPEDLKNDASLWANTLVKMYQEKFTWPAVLAPEQGKLLRNLVLDNSPENIVEIGCFIGASTIWMASALQQLGGNRFIHSIDLFADIMPPHGQPYRYLRDPLEYAQSCAASAQLSHLIEFHQMDSKEMGTRYGELINKPIDLLFIDGDHSIEGCLSDFILFYPYVAAGGYIVLHDIYPEYCGCDGPRYVIDKFIKNSTNFEVLEVNVGSSNYGMAVVRKLGTQPIWNKPQQWATSLAATRNFGMALMHKFGREIGVIRSAPTLGVMGSWRQLSLIHKLTKYKSTNKI